MISTADVRPVIAAGNGAGNGAANGAGNGAGNGVEPPNAVETIRKRLRLGLFQVAGRAWRPTGPAIDIRPSRAATPVPVVAGCWREMLPVSPAETVHAERPMTATPAPTHDEPAIPEPDAGQDRPHAASSAPHRRPARSAAATVRPSDLPREYRIAHVFRTLGAGLVAEYDPA